MKIQAVRIDGFKNLSDVRIIFDNITALVSLNNFGKSNVLKGIDFGLSFIKASSYEKRIMMANPDFIPINKGMQEKNFLFEVEVLTQEQGACYRVIYGYEFKWQRDENVNPEITQEYLRIKLDDKGQKFNKMIFRNQRDSLYKSSETGRCSSNIKIDSSGLIVNKLLAFDDLYYNHIIKKLNNMKFYMEDNLDVQKNSQHIPFIVKELDHTIIDNDNLARTIYQLKEQYPDKYELLLYVYKQLFPNVEDVIVEQYSVDGLKSKDKNYNNHYIVSRSIHMLYILDKNLIQPIDFELMSEGSKRVFMILTKLIVASINDISLIAIEEPENSVHPKLFQSYIQIINQLMNDCKIIITSHSPYIMNYLDPSWIHVGMCRTPGTAEFFKFKGTGQKILQKDAQKFNMNMGDYLFSLLSDSDSNISDYLECDMNE